MTPFNTKQDLVNNFAKQSLKSFFSDLKYWGETRTISEIKSEITKQRERSLLRVSIETHEYLAKLENVPIGSLYISKFGYVK